MNRRNFFGIAGASIFAPIFGRWYRQGSGLVVPMDPPGPAVVNLEDAFAVGGRRFVILGVGPHVLTVGLDQPLHPMCRNGLTNRAMFGDASRPLQGLQLHVVASGDFRPGDRLLINGEGLSARGKVVRIEGGRQGGKTLAVRQSYPDAVPVTLAGRRGGR